MPWSLVDALSTAGAGRRFFVPLASIPPGSSAVRAVDGNLFEINPDDPNHLETYITAGDGHTTDVVLTIQINQPAGGFADEAGLPDPAVRLHAMDVAMVTFRAADAALEDRLALQMPTFGLPLHTVAGGGVRWWRRWLEADSVPRTLIYENVDAAQLALVLNAVVAPVNDLFESRVPPTHGLSFPAGVTQANKAAFIAQFLAGADGYFMVAESGAYMGTAAQVPDLVGPGLPRLLRLHVQYEDHTNANPHPMNPREFFHLLFAHDSQEALNHPLLRRIDEVGQAQNAVHPESKRMLLRPPLRTWSRVMWEGNQEIANHQLNWRPAGGLGPNRFYNNHARNGRVFNDGNYATFNKCNLFVSDICLRAGFRVCLHPVGAANWHFLDANSFTNLAQRGAGATDRSALQGSNEDAASTWGWKFENWLRAQPAADRQRLLNEAMTEEGRCFILAGARPRRFINHQVLAAPATNGVSNCVASLRTNGIGHIVIVREVRGQPLLAATVGDGLQSIPVFTQEAAGAGATNGTRDGTAGNPMLQLGGAAGAAAGATGFIRLHLIELHPGGDPDTAQGLRSLNLRSVNRNLLGTANERAADRRMTHNAAGNPLAPAPAPGTCCRDTHPPANSAPIQVPC